MSLKDELRAELIDLDIKNINVFRQSDIKGRESTRVEIFTTADHDGAPVETRHTFEFARDNHMDVFAMVRVIDSYIRKADEVMA